MQLPLSVICLLLCQLAIGQPATRPYWQQKMNYQLTASVSPQEHTINGTLHLEYTNLSPDTLTFIWFHLWPNAYANDKTALYKQLKQIKARSKKIDAKKSAGYIDSINWKVNDVAAQALPHEDYNDVVKLMLPNPLLPNATATITTPFRTVLPNYYSRSGYFENSLFVTQWYPKPAVYDNKGWHPMPYLDMGEFYSEFGRYNVDITIPANYVVAASGQLQTAAEKNEYKRLGHLNYGAIDSAFAAAEARGDSNISVRFASYKPLTNEPTKTLRYTIDSVHDFAFFADPDFIINYDTIQTTSGHVIDAFSYYKKQRFGKWLNSIDDAKTAIRFYSDNVGAYPFSTVSLVQGTGNENSGGMEYPTITLITMKEEAELDAMDAVFAHEIGHNWFCEALASNERDHAWMDEGVNSFFQFRYEAYKNRSATSFGKIPPNLKELPATMFEGLIYQTIDQLPNKSAIDRPSQDFKQDEDYGISVYVKTAGWMFNLERKLGKETFAKCMKAYYNRWKFKHPYPEDMQLVFEQESGQDLNSYFQQLKQKKQTYN
jgi:hypothetical protein